MTNDLSFQIRDSFVKVPTVTDPLAEVVGLLQPGTLMAKIASGAGRWAVRREGTGDAFYALVLDGACRMAVDGQSPVTLSQGDFLLVPANFGFETTALAPDGPRDHDPRAVSFLPGEVRHGRAAGPADVRLLIGGFAFGFADAAVLVSLLPGLIHVPAGDRLSSVVHLISDEARNTRPGRDFVLARLLEVMMIEALRSTAVAGDDAPPGLLRGLADPRLAPALRLIHETPAQAWTVADLARDCALSRTAFFRRFTAAVGVAPMQYLLSWRMALARSLLRRGNDSIAAIAARTGYGSASAFTAAFTRHTGMPPARFARETA